MKKLFFLIFIALGLHAATITQEQPACISESLLDEFFNAIHNNDTRQIFVLVAQSKCFILKPGQNVSIIKRGFTQVTLRLYYEDGTYKVVAPIESIQ